LSTGFCVKINKVLQNSNAFPGVLKDIPQPPKMLYILGNLQPLVEKPRLAVVGSRKVTPYGRGVTEELVQAIAGQGIVIVSGLALGVDAIAHKAALEAGGKTIAVLPCGLDKPYPATNRQLARRILEQGGALISEYPAGTEPFPSNFIERNRLVSGLSDGVLITEAAAKSGTIHTAGFALEQGKTVMAVPGNITSELSKGTNNLIKSGATPVTSAQDILEALGIGEQLQFQEVLAANAEEEAILQLLRQGITDGSELQALSQLDAASFNQTLTMLEITGKVKAVGAGHWSIR
jgi:DNA processing protein